MISGGHARIIFQEARVGGGGRHVTHSSQNSNVLFIFPFIRNIPKRINYIIKYLDSHLYKLAYKISTSHFASM